MSREAAMTRSRCGRAPRFALGLLIACVCLFESGCAALTNPLDIGIPVRLLPPELLAKPKNDEHTIPLSVLGQKPPPFYILEPGDVLGIWIEAVVGEKTLPIPVHNTIQVQGQEQRNFPPAVGYPFEVQRDGTVNLPMVDPVPVRGLSLAEAQNAVRKAYIDKNILPPGRDRVLVTLLHPRLTKVVVMRQETPSFTPGPQGVVPTGKRGTGHVVDLFAYENDVLHALARSGGLPSLDAYNEIVIFRGMVDPRADKTVLLNQAETANFAAHTQVVKIPLRSKPGEPIHILPQDVVLQSGDVVFLEARDLDVFYTGGLLPAGEFILPRDRDLDVAQAVMQVRGPIINGAFGTNSLSGNLIAAGIGAPSPSLITVVRRTPEGAQVPIRVDLAKALRDPRENLNLRAGDMVFLQEKPSQAITRYATQTFFNFNLVWRAFETSNAVGVVDIAAPDRLPGRLFQNFNPGR